MQTKVEKLREAFQQGTLLTQTVSDTGTVEWKRVLDVSRAEVPWETLVCVSTPQGTSTLTGGHRVFVTPTEKKEAGHLCSGEHVLTLSGIETVAVKVSNVAKAPSRSFMYDLTTETWHNFVLQGTKLVVSNSPDRNYHFRPPEHEGRIGKYNRVFGQIWEDQELLVYMETALNDWNAKPPETEGLCSLDILCSRKPVWSSVIITRAMYWALYALAINWTADEFSVAGSTKVRVFLSDGSSASLQIDELYAILRGSVKLGGAFVTKLREDFCAGLLQVQSVCPSTNEVRFSTVTDVLKHHTGHKKMVKVSVEGALDVLCTEDHSLFRYRKGSVVPVRGESLLRGDLLAVSLDGRVTGVPITEVTFLPPHEETYDLSVPGDENFLLSNGILAHNSYSIGGISLDINKSSQYEQMKQNAKAEWDAQVESKMMTTKLIRGLQQPRFGIGIRSSFGPHVGRGILSPKSFM